MFQVSNADASFTNSLVIFLTLGISPVAAWVTSNIGNRLTLALGNQRLLVISDMVKFLGGIYLQPQRLTVFLIYKAKGACMYNPQLFSARNVRL